MGLTAFPGFSHPLFAHFFPHCEIWFRLSRAFDEDSDVDGGVWRKKNVTGGNFSKIHQSAFRFFYHLSRAVNFRYATQTPTKYTPGSILIRPPFLYRQWLTPVPIPNATFRAAHWGGFALQAGVVHTPAPPNRSHSRAAAPSLPRIGMNTFQKKTSGERSVFPGSFRISPDP